MPNIDKSKSRRVPAYLEDIPRTGVLHKGRRQVTRTVDFRGGLGLQLGDLCRKQSAGCDVTDVDPVPKHQDTVLPKI